MKKVFILALALMLGLGLVYANPTKSYAFESDTAKTVNEVATQPANGFKFQVTKTIHVSQKYKFDVKSLVTEIDAKVKELKATGKTEIKEDKYSASSDKVGTYDVKIKVSENVNKKKEEHVINVKFNVVKNTNYLYIKDGKELVVTNEMKATKETLISILKEAGYCPTAQDAKVEISTSDYIGKETAVGSYKSKLKVTLKGQNPTETDFTIKVVDAKNLVEKPNKLKEFFTNPFVYIVLGSVVVAVAAVIIVKVKKNR